MALESFIFLAFKVRAFWWEGREKRRRKKEEEKKKKIQVWNFCMETICVWITSMEPICMEIPLCLSCVGKILLEMLLVGIRLYFEFWLSWFWFRRKFPMKRAKFGHFCVQHNTLTPR